MSNQTKVNVDLQALVESDIISAHQKHEIENWVDRQNHSRDSDDHPLPQPETQLSWLSAIGLMMGLFGVVFGMGLWLRPYVGLHWTSVIWIGIAMLGYGFCHQRFKTSEPHGSQVLWLFCFRLMALVGLMVWLSVSPFNTWDFSLYAKVWVAVVSISFLETMICFGLALFFDSYVMVGLGFMMVVLYTSVSNYHHYTILKSDIVLMKMMLTSVMGLFFIGLRRLTHAYAGLSGSWLAVLHRLSWFAVGCAMITLHGLCWLWLFLPSEAWWMPGWTLSSMIWFLLSLFAALWAYFQGALFYLRIHYVFIWVNVFVQLNYGFGNDVNEFLLSVITGSMIVVASLWLVHIERLLNLNPKRLHRQETWS